MTVSTEVWIQVLVAICGAAVNLAILVYFFGKKSELLRSIGVRLGAVEEKVAPKDPEHQLVTQSMCDQCQTECNRRNADHFRNLTTMLEKQNEVSCDIREAVGWVRGKLENGKS